MTLSSVVSLTVVVSETLVCFVVSGLVPLFSGNKRQPVNSVDIIISVTDNERDFFILITSCIVVIIIITRRVCRIMDNGVE